MATDLLSTIRSQATREEIQRQMRYPIQAAVPEVDIMDYVDDPNAVAAVSRAMPTTILINTQGDLKKFPQTIMHELEHVLQNKASARGSSYDMQVLDLIKQEGGTMNQLVTALEKSISSVKLKDHLKTKYNLKPSAYIGGVAGGGQFSLRESFAELSALEQQANKDLTKDPVVREEFFNNDKNLIAVYKATTGLRQTRLDAKDLPPMTVQKETPSPSKDKEVPSVLDKILNILR